MSASFLCPPRGLIRRAITPGDGLKEKAAISIINYIVKVVVSEGLLKKVL